MSWQIVITWLRGFFIYFLFYFMCVLVALYLHANFISLITLQKALLHTCWCQHFIRGSQCFLEQEQPNKEIWVFFLCCMHLLEMLMVLSVSTWSLKDYRSLYLLTAHGSPWLRSILAQCCPFLLLLGSTSSWSSLREYCFYFGDFFSRSSPVIHLHDM